LLFASRALESRICFYLCSYSFRISLLVSLICSYSTIALYDLAAYIQQYSYDIDLTWIAVE
ncbi:hypothetical protein, partial [Vibrio crassostreae]|uniref:hypothetical protein n=1 Tax=Vibrio crassostreae TaxID=246167 RepID=UPI001B307044